MNTRGAAGLWGRHSAEWRDPAQVVSQWLDAANVDPRLLNWKASRGWWDLIAELKLTLLVTREYEHLVMAFSAPGGRPRSSYFPLPHPSGLTVDRKRKRVYLASTRNPNQLVVFRPVSRNIERLDTKTKAWPGSPLVPVTTTNYPGCLYIHDLAIMRGHLLANAVGHNAVVQLGAEGCFDRVWWPRCIERAGRPVFGQNHIQLNSIAAGATLADSFFSASSAELGRLRPGHLKYPVDGRGVIFSGRTREAICTGLTRPHSARLGKSRRIWVANSGYGELGYVNGGKLEVVAKLPGWTRGLCIAGDLAFVATSRVIPKYACYAPGLDMTKSRCGIHAVSLSTGKIVASLDWPYGNQIFAVDWMDASDSLGFVFRTGTRNMKAETAFFYTYLSDPRNSSGAR